MCNLIGIDAESCIIGDNLYHVYSTNQILIAWAQYEITAVMMLEKIDELSMISVFCHVLLIWKKVLKYLVGNQSVLFLERKLNKN